MKRLTAVLFLTMAASAVAVAASPDRGFYVKAAKVGMAEVETGKLAQQKGGSDAVRNFGAKMVQDHTAANEKLMALAASKQIKLPKGMDLKHKIMHKSLSGKSGAEFDKAYIKGQIADHKATIELFEREIASGKDADAKAFAAANLPVVQSHLAMLQAMTGGTAGANMGGHAGSQSGNGASHMNSNMPAGGPASRPSSSSPSNTGSGTSGASGTSGMGSGSGSSGASSTGGAGAGGAASGSSGAASGGAR